MDAEMTGSRGLLEASIRLSMDWRSGDTFKFLAVGP